MRTTQIYVTVHWTAFTYFKIQISENRITDDLEDTDHWNSGVFYKTRPYTKETLVTITNTNSILWRFIFSGLLSNSELQSLLLFQQNVWAVTKFPLERIQKALAPSIESQDYQYVLPETTWKQFQHWRVPYGTKLCSFDSSLLFFPRF